MRKTLVVISIVGLAAWLWAVTVHAQQGGPGVVTNADVTVGTSCATVLSASATGTNSSIPNRICANLDNTGSTNAARCGDANTTSTRGMYIPPLGSKTMCITGAITCCAAASTTTIAPTETTR